MDFECLDATPEALGGADVAYCCLGTTRAKAGAQGFIRVDYDYVVNSAKILKEKGCQSFHLLTSKGSDPNSFFLYPKTKGRVEEACKEIGFQRMDVYRYRHLNWRDFSCRFFFMCIQTKSSCLPDYPPYTLTVLQKKTDNHVGWSFSC